MAEYALLILPSANRVYADSAVALTQAELRAFNQAVLGGRLTDVATTTIGGVPYVTFGAAAALSDTDAAFLANLSAAYALFQLEDGLLRPVELHRLDRFDDDLITILKYQGKTNEQFTKLLLNVTLLASAHASDMLTRKFAVLDPLCGRGTTLSLALTYGYDATGIDLDQRDFDAYAAFIQTWLKRKRIPHRTIQAPVRGSKKTFARRLQVSLAADRTDYKAGTTQQLDVLNIDTMRAREFLRPGTFDLIVTDAPYGVQHGSRTVAEGLRRSPLDLLAAATPVWAELLRSGGACGIAWNTFVAGRDETVAILSGAGLEVVDSGPYPDFRHRVDQAIMRDILVARKP